ncbi:precorrin-2 dehydrogenase/sirohydrochlorin ferrochelatase family protein [Anaerocolumna sp. MB42-C2]|uniref:precorrin-2 dehydrogenase/sirohydrochlorin ferrochelatase family protein n=1 Tax=Anaerocolumna sp. MB42-C2 TaxID=3070997 RepID=UPI0027E094D6|nr:bifunctional precorrin-2 dehydrogenase/sirohydrochlorin ferrochelatase [Anaerocolumna sp. MB42-C2]WMJ88060.1 bifunctional precorrin-2 dehydrogenase/sirohydrochlorin ferrochelatase [Anaerocolumna sp. MB42-C2]
MAYFPMFVDLKDELCIVIGGGMVACRKIRVLLEFEAEVVVVAPEFCECVMVLKDKITLINKFYEATDIKDAFLVIAATDDIQLNTRISRECKGLRIPVNVVDKKEECSFIFPAYVKKGAITVGITSSGKSPVISKRIKSRIKEVIPDYMEELVEILGDIRDEVQFLFEQEAERKLVYKQLVELGCLKQGKLTKTDIQDVIKRVKENQEI